MSGLVVLLLGGLALFLASQAGLLGGPAAPPQAVPQTVIVPNVVTQTVIATSVITVTEQATVIVTATPLPVTDTPEPTPTEAATATPVESPTPEPTPTATPDVGVPVPFTDNFDDGRRPEWKIVNGEPIINDGRLGSTGTGLTLELGNEKLIDYTIEFVPIGDKYGGVSYVLQLGPEFRLLNGDSSGHPYCMWQRWENNKWVDKVTLPRCLGLGSGKTFNGRFKVQVRGNEYSTYFNDELGTKTIYEGVTTKGPVQVILLPGQMIDNFELTVP